LGGLERGVLAALALTCRRASADDDARAKRLAATALELIVATRADDGEHRRTHAWHFDDGLALPLDLAPAELEQAAALLEATCRASGVTPVAMRARLVFPAEFNALVEHFGNKSSALSHVTLALVRAVVDELPEGDDGEPISIYLDKHGGRNRYTALVQHHFDDCWVHVADEGRAESRYEWEHRGMPIEAVFRVGCEALLPTALASMTAKYHRELAMHAFNAFWTARVPGLRPTAGYYGDSRRFRSEVDGAQRALGIEDRVMWRCR
jgi:hypothetical protein